jgi:tRNA A37 methylthiotransferase MiaB
VPAGSFPDQVPAHIRDARQKILLETGKLAFTQFATESLGKKLRLLVEKNAGETFSGWSENYLFINETNFIEYPQEAIAR